ncbi:phage tail tape measure protein [Ancylobacter sonchi]|uniref:phage tail tape measure protein n=1 Tax=Ancylobacter sonchi TaxID=1937790 RepID=UPI001BD5BF14|nr:phage tail tape measure protein [Ancylobacter sonchi]MBS7534996.1 phage tail tape measure protein [Ancylobacter sonchi]
MTQPLDIRGVAEITDRVSPTLARIGASMGAVARNPALKRVAVDMSGVSRATQGVGRALGGVGRGLQSVAWNFAAVGSLAALGVVTYFGAVSSAAYAAAKSFAAAGSGISDVADRLGVSAQSLQEWRYAAETSGASAGALDAGLGQLQKTMVDVSRGKNKDAAGLFRKLGISVKDAHGKLKPLETLLPQLAQAFEKNKDPALRARMAMTLFGESGAALVPMLADGRQGLKDIAAEARKLGIIISDDDVKRAKRLGDEMDKTGTAFQGLGLTIGSALEPVLTPLLRQFREWITLNREWVALKVKQAVMGLRDAFAGFDMKQFIIQTETGFKRIDGFVRAIGGWKGALIGLAGVLTAPLWVPIVQLGLALGKLAFNIIKVGSAALAMGGWPVILGLAAVAGALRNWEGFSAGIGRIWDGFKKLFTGDVFGAMGDIWGGQFDTLTAIVSGLLKILDDTFSTDWSAKFEGGVQRIREIMNDVATWVRQAIADIQAAWNSLSFTGITGAAPAANGSRGQTITPGTAPAPAAPNSPSSDSPPRQYRGRYGSLSDRPSLYAMERRDRVADAGGAMRGGATLNVKFQNAPAGTTAAVHTQGAAFGTWDLDMGHSGRRGPVDPITKELYLFDRA